MDQIKVGEKEIYLLGTAHVSKQSTDDVRKAIEELKPDSVCVELCEARYEAITNPEAWKSTDLFTLIKQGKSYVLLTQLILSSYQKRIAEKLGVKPGEEMRVAVELAQKSGAHLELVDRNIKVTLRRAWHGAGFWGVLKLFFSGLWSLATSSNDVSEEEIEQMKSADVLTELVAEFGDNLPGAKIALIDERDLYMAHLIKNTPGNKILAVLGAGHLPGIRRLLHEETSIVGLDDIPPTRKVTKLFGYGIPVAVIGAITYGFFSAGADFSLDLIKQWILFNGTLSALGVVIAGGHILTIITAFVAAPFTSLNPMIAAGWVAGLVETWKKRPVVQDFDTLSDDILTFRGFWKNQITRILLVVAFANIGSTIGSVVAAGSIASSIWA